MMSSAEGSGRCAILQFEGVHEEVVPSLALAMNSAGLNCHSIVNRRCVDRRGDVFAEVGRDLGTVEYVDLEGRPDWQKLDDSVAAGNYNVLLFSTFQRDNGSYETPAAVAIAPVEGGEQAGAAPEAAPATKSGESK